MDCILGSSSRWRARLLRLAKALMALAYGHQCGCSSARLHEVQEAPGAIVVIGLAPNSDVHIKDAAGVAAPVGRTNSCGVVVFEPLPDGIYSVGLDAEVADSGTEKVQVTRGKDSLVQKRQGPPSNGSETVPTNCTPPRKVSGPDPHYTRTALMQNVQGCLVIECVITLAGSVRNCRALQPVSELTESAIAALEQRRYTPMTCDGKPIVSDYTFRINFRMPR